MKARLAATRAARAPRLRADLSLAGRAGPVCLRTRDRPMINRAHIVFAFSAENAQALRGLWPRRLRWACSCSTYARTLKLGVDVGAACCGDRHLSDLDTGDLPGLGVTGVSELPELIQSILGRSDQGVPVVAQQCIDRRPIKTLLHGSGLVSGSLVGPVGGDLLRNGLIGDGLVSGGLA